MECQADEYKSRISVLDKSVEDLKGKLAAEEGKRKELQNRVKQLSNESQSTKAESKTEDKPASVSSRMRCVFVRAGDKCTKFLTRLNNFQCSAELQATIGH